MPNTISRILHGPCNMPHIIWVDWERRPILWTMKPVAVKVFSVAFYLASQPFPNHKTKLSKSVAYFSFLSRLQLFLVSKLSVLWLHNGIYISQQFIFLRSKINDIRILSPHFNGLPIFCCFSFIFTKRFWNSKFILIFKNVEFSFTNSMSWFAQ